MRRRWRRYRHPLYARAGGPAQEHDRDGEFLGQRLCRRRKRLWQRHRGRSHRGRRVRVEQLREQERHGRGFESRGHLVGRRSVRDLHGDARRPFAHVAHRLLVEPRAGGRQQDPLPARRHRRGLRRRDQTGKTHRSGEREIRRRSRLFRQVDPRMGRSARGGFLYGGMVGRRHRGEGRHGSGGHHLGLVPAQGTGGRHRVPREGQGVPLQQPRLRFGLLRRRVAEDGHSPGTGRDRRVESAGDLPRPSRSNGPVRTARRVSTAVRRSTT